jgi:hypothetical protein
VGSSNVKYDIDNPINVKYNFTNVGYYEIVWGELDDKKSNFYNFRVC